METLIAIALLWKYDLCTCDEYNVHLDEIFLEYPNNDVLLELEECSSDCDSTFHRLYHFWNYEYPEFDTDLFGKSLFSRLQTIYMKNIFSIEEFGKRCYQLWSSFPEKLYAIQPFWTLSYADDCLSYGDEKQTRKLYEEAFNFYK